MARRLLISLLAVVVATVLAMFWATTHTINSTFEDFRNVHLDAHLHHVPHELFSHYRKNESWNGVETVIDNISRSINLDIALVDAQQNVVASTSTNIRAIATQANKSQADFFIPLQAGSTSEQIGTVYFQSSSLLRQRDQEFLRQLILTAALVGIGTALLASAISYFVARSFSQPIIELSEAAEKVARGNYNIQVETTRSDEIGILGQTFNQMATEIGQLEKVRRNLVVNVSHDLRTPLTIVHGYLEGLHSGKILDRRSAERAFNVMHKEVTSLITLIDSLNEVAALDSGEIPLNLSCVSVDYLVNSAVERIQPSADIKRVTLLAEREPESHQQADPITLDIDKIGQVLYNLLDNAIHYSAPEDTVTIRGRLTKDDVVFIVTDQGEGIPLEQQPFIFERFYRADQTQNRQRGGYGMGLSIVRSIIHAHSGTVDVTSSGQAGDITQFTIKIPRANTEG